jgi:hypothetical protein
VIGVSIVISDPWELGEAVGWRPLLGTMIELVDDDEGGRGLIRLNVPLSHAGGRYGYVLASPRHEGERLHALRAGNSVFCGLVGLTDVTPHSRKLLDVSSWRGGLAFIATVEPRDM